MILLIAGEHARELITSEIAFWLGKLLAGKPLCTIAQFWRHGVLNAAAWSAGYALPGIWRIQRQYTQCQTGRPQQCVLQEMTMS